MEYKWKKGRDVGLRGHIVMVVTISLIIQGPVLLVESLFDFLNKESG